MMKIIDLSILCKKEKSALNQIFSTVCYSCEKLPPHPPLTTCKWTQLFIFLGPSLALRLAQSFGLKVLHQTNKNILINISIDTVFTISHETINSKNLIIFLFCLFHIEFLQGHFDKISGELKIE